MSDTTAIAKLDEVKKSGALMFFREEDLHPQAMFKPVITQIPVVRSDFHERPMKNGELLPKQHHVSRIADAAGITLETVDKIKDETSWTVTVRAKRRGPDGTERSADGSYSFDWVERAKDGGKQVALQRAETGARSRAIKAVLGLPTTFGQDNINRALAVCRIVVDTDAMLKDPEMRTAAIEMATGASSAMFGPGEKNVTPEAAQIAGPDNVEDSDDFEVPGEVAETPKEDTPKSPAFRSILEYEAAYRLPQSAQSEINKGREIGPDNIEEIKHEDLLRRIKNWIQKHPEATR